VDELVDRMVVVGTIEEKILELQKTKKDLVSTLISEEKTALKDFKSEEIMKLFER
jgi:SNF2 family DNA or RNA helicase